MKKQVSTVSPTEYEVKDSCNIQDGVDPDESEEGTFALSDVDGIDPFEVAKLFKAYNRLGFEEELQLLADRCGYCIYEVDNEEE